MNQYNTPVEIGEPSSPSLKDFYRIANQRRLLTPKEEGEFVRAEKGFIGEDLVYQFILSEANENWVILRNQWLFIDGPFECDFILITNQVVFVLEVKHYVGRFTYENGICIIGNMKMENDCIQQTRKSYLKLQKILSKWQPNLTVKGALVFSNNKNKVVIHSPIEDISILELPDLYECLQQMKFEEARHPYPKIDYLAMMQHLQQYKIPNLYVPKPKSPEEMQAARKGISCGRCNTFDVVSTKFYVDCPCGFHESREEAIIRSACDYGVLTYNRDFSTGDILNFIDNQGSEIFVQKILAKHFKRFERNKHSTYENAGRDYRTMTNRFHFLRPAYYCSKPKL